MVDRLLLDAMSPLAEGFPLRHLPGGLEALSQGVLGGRMKGPAKARVGQILRSIDFELLGCPIHPFGLVGIMVTQARRN
jgi:hypothetical protein